MAVIYFWHINSANIEVPHNRCHAANVVGMRVCGNEDINVLYTVVLQGISDGADAISVTGVNQNGCAIRQEQQFGIALSYIQIIDL